MGLRVGRGRGWQRLAGSGIAGVAQLPREQGAGWGWGLGEGGDCSHHGASVCGSRAPPAAGMPTVATATPRGRWSHPPTSHHTHTPHHPPTTHLTHTTPPTHQPNPYPSTHPPTNPIPTHPIHMPPGGQPGEQQGGEDHWQGGERGALFAASALPGGCWAQRAQHGQHLAGMAATRLVAGPHPPTDSRRTAVLLQEAPAPVAVLRDAHQAVVGQPAGMHAQGWRRPASLPAHRC